MKMRALHGSLAVKKPVGGNPSAHQLRALGKGSLIPLQGRGHGLAFKACISRGWGYHDTLLILELTMGA
jgi:hypothetical protein